MRATFNPGISALHGQPYALPDGVLDHIQFPAYASGGELVPDLMETANGVVLSGLIAVVRITVNTAPTQEVFGVLCETDEEDAYLARITPDKPAAFYPIDDRMGLEVGKHTPMGRELKESGYPLAPFVSRHHFHVRTEMYGADERRVVVRDLGSTNGTEVRSHGFVLKGRFSAPYLGG